MVLWLVGCVAHAPLGGSLPLWREPTEAGSGGGIGEGRALDEHLVAMPSSESHREEETRTRALRVEKERAEALVRAVQGEGRGPEAVEAARKAETARALAQVVGLTRGVEETGTTLTFSFWVEEGALTPLGYREKSGDGHTGRAVEAAALERVLHPIFTEYLSRRTGEVVLTLRREEARWTVDYDATHQGARPPEAKTLPLRARGTTADSLLAFHEAARKGLHAVQVPAGSAERVELAVRLEDGRLLDWELMGARRTREGPGGTPWPLSPDMAGHTVQVLLPFSEGIGPRTVHLVLRAEHRLGETEARGRVESVRVERPPSAFALTPEQNWYHSMHEGILLRWREDVYEGSAWLARKGVDELALWCVGGILAKGVGFFGTKGLEWIPRALNRGPEAAAGWLRSALKRLPTQEKKVFEQLWGKVALEGEQALTRSERQTLRGLFVHLERVIQQPLDPRLKENLRHEARDYYRKLYPQFSKSLEDLAERLPIHHRRQLEHAHLFPDEDINAGENLAMVQRYVHLKINFLWGRFRRARPHPTAEEVRRAAETIDRHFAPWYHRIDDPPGLSRTAEEAREAALRELRSQFPGLD
jgi:hypothetical protein